MQFHPIGETENPGHCSHIGRAPKMSLEIPRVLMEVNHGLN
jgi:hypothetical protein